MNLFLMLLLILLLLVLAYVIVPKVSKSEIWRPYRVDGKTFQKWLDNQLPDFAPTWRKRRKFTLYELNLIESKLGDPSKFPTLNMKGLFSRLEDEEREELPAAKYRLLHKLIPTLKTRFAGMSVFPPRIAEQLYVIAKGDIDPEILYA